MTMVCQLLLELLYAHIKQGQAQEQQVRFDTSRQQLAAYMQHHMHVIDCDGATTVIMTETKLIR